MTHQDGHFETMQDMCTTLQWVSNTIRSLLQFADDTQHSYPPPFMGLNAWDTKGHNLNNGRRDYKVGRNSVAVFCDPPYDTGI